MVLFVGISWVNYPRVGDGFIVVVHVYKVLNMILRSSSTEVSTS